MLISWIYFLVKKEIVKELYEMLVFFVLGFVLIYEEMYVCVIEFVLLDEVMICVLVEIILFYLLGILVIICGESIIEKYICELKNICICYY